MLKLSRNDQILYYIKIDDNSSIDINITELTNVVVISGYTIISDNLGNLLYFHNNGVVDSNNFIHIFSTNIVR